MRLFPKLAIALALVALVPIAVLGVLGLGPTSDALRERLEHGQAQLAAQAADLAALRVRSVLQSLRQNVSYGDFATERTEILTGILRIAYRQSDDITAVSLIDERGEAAVPSVFLEDPAATPALRRHPPVSDADLDEHGRHIPLGGALASGAAVGPPYGARGRPRVALAVETPGRRNGQRTVLVAEMSLEELDRALRALAGPSQEVILIRPDCTTMRDGEGPVPLPAGRVCRQRVPAERSAGAIEAGGRRYLGAFAPVPLLGWGVVARQVESDALAPMTRLRSQIVFWAAIGVALALLLAFVVARDLSRRIEVLAGHSQALARGELGHRVEVESRDELGLLAASLNTTAKEIEAQRDQIEAQNREITTWNEELEQRVAQKTDELARAQEAVLRSRRLAGLGVLGAGVAHEINNPLASALGFVQLTLHDKQLPDKHRASLAEAQKAALRIREIVHELLKLADTESEPAHGQVDLNDTARRAAQMVAGRLVEGSIELELELEPKLPPVRGNGDRLVEAALHLVTNARQAMAGPGAITLRTRQTGGQLVSLDVIDRGAGIPDELIDRVFDPFFTTKGTWESRGLGLSVVHKIAEEHGGHLELRSKVGEGTTATITLPAAAAQRHLE